MVTSSRSTNLHPAAEEGWLDGLRRAEDARSAKPRFYPPEAQVAHTQLPVYSLLRSTGSPTRAELPEVRDTFSRKVDDFLGTSTPGTAATKPWHAGYLMRCFAKEATRCEEIGLLYDRRDILDAPHDEWAMVQAKSLALATSLARDPDERSLTLVMAQLSLQHQPDHRGMDWSLSKTIASRMAWSMGVVGDLKLPFKRDRIPTRSELEIIEQGLRYLPFGADHHVERSQIRKHLEGAIAPLRSRSTVSTASIASAEPSPVTVADFAEHQQTGIPADEALRYVRGLPWKANPNQKPFAAEVSGALRNSEPGVVDDVLTSIGCAMRKKVMAGGDSETATATAWVVSTLATSPRPRLRLYAAEYLQANVVDWDQTDWRARALVTLAQDPDATVAHQVLQHLHDRFWPSISVSAVERLEPNQVPINVQVHHTADQPERWGALAERLLDHTNPDYHEPGQRLIAQLGSSYRPGYDQVLYGIRRGDPVWTHAASTWSPPDAQIARAFADWSDAAIRADAKTWWAAAHRHAGKDDGDNLNRGLTIAVPLLNDPDGAMKMALAVATEHPNVLPGMLSRIRRLQYGEHAVQAIGALARSDVPDDAERVTKAIPKRMDDYEVHMQGAYLQSIHEAWRSRTGARRVDAMGQALTAAAAGYLQHPHEEIRVKMVEMVFGGGEMA